MFKSAICILGLLAFASAWYNNGLNRGYNLKNSYSRNSISNGDGIVFVSRNRNGGSSAGSHDWSGPSSFSGPTFSDYSRPTFSDNSGPTFSDNSGPTFSDNSGPTFSDYSGPSGSDFSGDSNGWTGDYSGGSYDGSNAGSWSGSSSD